MGYELWDTEAGNLIGAFADQAEALTVVRAQVAADGPQAVEWLSLEHVSEAGRVIHTIARGRELLALIQVASS